MSNLEIMINFRYLSDAGLCISEICNNISDLYQDITDCGVDWSEFAEGKLAASTVDGKHYGVPFDNGAEIACYRTDILKQAGYTIDDLTDID